MQITEDTQDELNTLPLDVYLPDMAKKLGVHITVHYNQGTATSPTSPFKSTATPMDTRVGTVEEFTQEIKRHIKDVEFVIDKQDKANTVIHLIDGQLGKNKSVLEQKIDLDWSGHPSELADELEKRGVPGIKQPLSLDNRDGMVADYKTEMRIKAERQSLRDVFTHNLDLNNYHELVWIAVTEQDPRNGEWRTWVRFTGPKQRQN